MKKSGFSFLRNLKTYSDNYIISPPASNGFTIVELLVVIVVIGVLATITIVSYTGISQKATIASLTSDLSNASKLLKLDQVVNGIYPVTLEAANGGKGIPRSDNIDYQYSVDNSTTPQGFCITAIKSNQSYKITNNSAPISGDCQSYGLVLSFDAGDPTSYPGSGTIWTDLSGNGNNGTLINGVGYSNIGEGSLVFDGINDKVQTNYGPQFSDYTVCVWFKDDGVNSYGRLVDKAYTGGFWMGRNSVTANSWGGGIKETSGLYGIFLNLTDGNWNYLVSERQGTTHALYGNGVANTISNTVSSTALDNTTIAIGGWSVSGTQWFKGNIAVVKIYNRALSTAEIQRFYDTTKSRFGY